MDTCFEETASDMQIDNKRTTGRVNIVGWDVETESRSDSTGISWYVPVGYRCTTYEKLNCGLPALGHSQSVGLRSVVSPSKCYRRLSNVLTV